MTSTNALEAQIAALVRQLEETKEAERLEEARREAEATVEKAHEEKAHKEKAHEEGECRLQAEAEHVRRDALPHRVKQERQEKEEEEVVWIYFEESTSSMHATVLLQTVCNALVRGQRHFLTMSQICQLEGGFW